MEYTYPSYYKKFTCTADKCSDTCCAGWGIAIDNKSLKRYKQADKELGAFGNRLYNSIDWEDGSFYQHGKRCAFLNEDNLCDMVLEAGEDYLCKTCRRYPRHYEEFENLREVLLSLSCPEVAQILLTCQEKVTYETVVQERDQVEEYEYFDFLLFTKLQDVRLFIQEIFQNRELSIAERMAFVLAMVHDMQTRIRKQELFGIDNILDKCERESAWKQVRKKWPLYQNRKSERRYLLHSMFLDLQSLEVLNAEFVTWMHKAQWILYQELTETDYEAARKTFAECDEQIAIQQEQLLVYFLYSYFCGAVYDEDAFSKIKLAIVHTLLLSELFLARWIQNGNHIAGTPLTLEEKVDIAHRYAREIEHSDPNLNKVENLMREKTKYSLYDLLVVILN
ncbi:MAG: flagellin lysine-N-methylase [Eubacterium sp.]|nr:flagellin lysine-N-methylase [Eubacterium sp.]